MDNTSTQPSAFKFALKWGSIIGLVGLIANTVCAHFDLLGQQFVLWSEFLLITIAAFFLVRNYRNKHLKGFITFGKAFSISLQIFIYTSLFCIILGTVVQQYLFPKELERIAKISEQKIISDKTMSDEQIDMSLKITRTMVYNPVIRIVSGIAMYAFIGSIAALIIAATCKKESGEFLPDV